MDKDTVGYKMGFVTDMDAQISGVEIFNKQNQEIAGLAFHETTGEISIRFGESDIELAAYLKLIEKARGHLMDNVEKSREP